MSLAMESGSAAVHELMLVRTPAILDFRLQYFEFALTKAASFNNGKAAVKFAFLLLARGVDPNDR